MEVTKEYTNGEVTVVWKPGACVHSGICVKGLPNVFKPKEKPWINVEAATTQQLIDQVRQCPSGALSYYMNDARPAPDTDITKETLDTKVEVMPNGPLLVYGTLTVQHKDGSTETKNKTTAFCRCGASKNKPYCDGNHVKADFKG